MKIGLFGDSFATDNSFSKSDVRHLDYLSWPNIISGITNYAKSSSYYFN